MRRSRPAPGSALRRPAGGQEERGRGLPEACARRGLPRLGGGRSHARRSTPPGTSRRPSSRRRSATASTRPRSEAAQKLEFEPATKDGKPVASRIRFVYRFTPPPGVLAGKCSWRRPSRPIAGATIVVRDASGQERHDDDGRRRRVAHRGAPAGTYHVTVTADRDGAARGGRDGASRRGGRARSTGSSRPKARAAAPGRSRHRRSWRRWRSTGRSPPREVTKFTLDQREIARIPGTNGDALRSLQNLPGRRPPARARGPSHRPRLGARRTRSTSSTARRCRSSTTSAVSPRSCRPRCSNRIDFYPGQLQHAVRPRDGRHRRRRASPSPKSDQPPRRWRRRTSSTRAPSCRGPSSTRGGTSRSRGAGRASTSGSGRCSRPPTRTSASRPSTTTTRPSSSASSTSTPILRFAVFGSDDRSSSSSRAPRPSAPTPRRRRSARTRDSGGCRRSTRTSISSDTELRVVAAVGQDYVEFNAGNIYFHLTD